MPVKSPFSSKEIQRLVPRHFRMLDLKMAGYTNKQIADVVNCSEGSVKIISRSPLFIAEINRRLSTRNENKAEEEVLAYASKARIILEKSGENAATTQVDLLESDDDSVRLRASGSILDRVLGKTDAGSTAGTTINVQINETHAQLLVLALKESSNAQRQLEPSPDSTTAGATED